MSFVDTSIINRPGNVTREIADSQDYGIVKVDDNGNILLYNRYEADMAGVEPSHAEGRSFFTQVAPCTNNRLFFGKFKEGVSNGHLNEQFKYTFTYKMKPTPVDIHLYRDQDTKTNWVFVKKAA